MRAVLLSALLALVPAVLAAQAGAAATLRVQVLDQPARTLTAEEWRAIPRVEVRAEDHHGNAGTFAGVPLRAVLAAAGAPLGDKLRGPELADYVLVEAADGYRAVFSLAELDGGFHELTVVLADTRDGAALPAAEGPVRLVIPDERRPARWVRQVTSIRVVRAPAAR